jgi:hypothetical protein
VFGARLLRLWVRIPPGAWMSVCLSVLSVEVCHLEVCSSGWSFFQRSSTDCGVSVCDHESSIMRRPWPHRGLLPLVKKNSFQVSYIYYFIMIFGIILIWLGTWSVCKGFRVVELYFVLFTERIRSTDVGPFFCLRDFINTSIERIFTKFGIVGFTLEVGRIWFLFLWV